MSTPAPSLRRRLLLLHRRRTAGTELLRLLLIAELVPQLGDLLLEIHPGGPLPLEGRLQTVDHRPLLLIVIIRCKSVTSF